MALLYRKLVRDALLTLLSDPSVGFNPTFAGLASQYSVAPITIDFTASSQTFAVSHIEKGNIEHSRLLQYPAACLYTSDVVDRGDPHGFMFAGQVMAHVDFFVRERQGIEGFDTESQFDAIEDAVLSVVNRPTNQWPGGVAFQRQAQMSREYLIPLADGFGTIIPIGLLFGVYV